MSTVRACFFEMTPPSIARDARHVEAKAAAVAKKNNGVVLSGQGVLALFAFIRIVVKTFVVDANMA